jgi:Ni,Fe-hydrogenase III large subunit
MPALTEAIQQGRRIAEHRPWPRLSVTPEVWDLAADRLADGAWTLLGLWGESQAMHMAVFDEMTDEVNVLSLDCRTGHFPSVARKHVPAMRLERAISDLFGLVADGSPDCRPWLDHGRWEMQHPLGRGAPPAEAVPYAFLPAEGESLHQVAVGPVHAGIIEPGHFRFTVNGETVVRLEERLGYAHKGIEGLMAGAPIGRAAQLAARTSGDSTVAYGLAFARAVEAALGVDVPPRAHWLRALMAELERLANHFGDIGGICNDAAFAIMLAHMGVLRERVLRAADRCFGHRLMRDRVLPGGVAADVTREAMHLLSSLVGELRRDFQPLVKLYDETPSLQDRTVRTGIVRPELAKQFGAGGFFGRASNRAFDARRRLAYPPYDSLKFDVPVREEGDVNARVWIRIREVEQSLSLIEQILEAVPGGPLQRPIPTRGGEGMAIVEGFRGDILVWVRVSEVGKVVRCHLRDPSWFQWPLVEAAIEGNIVADFPLCNKSFNCAYSGHDL